MYSKFLNVIEMSVILQGGKFCYLEHTRSKDLIMRTYQTIVTPIFYVILNGCHYNREPHSSIEESGLFRETVFYLQLATSLPFYHPERTQASLLYSHQVS